MLFGQVLGIPQSGQAAGHDGYLHQRMRMLQEPPANGVTSFVVSDNLLLFWTDDLVLFFQTADDFIEGVVKVFHVNRFFIEAGGNKRCFVAHVRDVGTHKTGCHFRKGERRHVVGKLDGFEVHLENLGTALQIRTPNTDLAVKPARTHKGIVQNIWPVGSRHQDDTFIGWESIHFDQKLVKGVFALVVAALYGSAAACTSNGVYFIDKNDARGFLTRLSEKVSHAGSTHADEHFHEI